MPLRLAIIAEGRDQQVVLAEVDFEEVLREKLGKDFAIVETALKEVKADLKRRTLSLPIMIPEGGGDG